MRSEAINKRDRIIYIIQAAVEYWIALIVSDVFLATLTKELGFSDSATGIISSIITIGCLFQIASTFFSRVNIKKYVIILSVSDQLLFMFLFLIPLVKDTVISPELKRAIFVVAIISAYVLLNLAGPRKSRWMNDPVSTEIRGRFTANKEIISLLTGMIFTYASGAMIDYFKQKSTLLAAAGDAAGASAAIKTAFLICAVAVFVIMISHTILLVLHSDTTDHSERKKASVRDLGHALKDKNVLKIAIVFCLWHFAWQFSVPFFGAYKNNDLGFSLTFSSILSIGYSIIRSVMSRVWGVYADKKSFAKMFFACVCVMIVGFFTVSFANPSNGRVIFILYTIFYASATAGTNSAMFNFSFEFVAKDKLESGIAVINAVGGISGFLTTLVMSRVVSAVQAAGNTVFGFHIYAQQILAFGSCILMCVVAIYIRKVLYFMKKEPQTEKIATK